MNDMVQRSEYFNVSQVMSQKEETFITQSPQKDHHPWTKYLKNHNQSSQTLQISTQITQATPPKEPKLHYESVKEAPKFERKFGPIGAYDFP